MNDYKNKDTLEELSYYELKDKLKATTSLPEDGTDVIADVWVKIQVQDKPVFDAATQKLELQPSVLEVDTWIKKWLIVNLTQTELDVISNRNLTDLKESKSQLISEIVVTTSLGNTFDGHDEARANMNEAITASGILGLTEHNWKLADNTVALISVDEIKEALALAIQAKGAIVLGA